MLALRGRRELLPYDNHLREMIKNFDRFEGKTGMNSWKTATN